MEAIRKRLEKDALSAMFFGGVPPGYSCRTPLCIAWLRRADIKVVDDEKQAVGKSRIDFSSS
jgi:hypothetical protein